MFDLEKFIADWRRQMLATGVQSPVPLAELEVHLRDEIDHQVKSGCGVRKAFEISIRQIGHPQSLKSEFNKIERNIMKRILILCAGVVSILVGTAFVMPAVAQYRHTGAMANDEPWLFLLGSLLTLAGIGTAWAGARKRLA